MPSKNKTCPECDALLTDPKACSLCGWHEHEKPVTRQAFTCAKCGSADIYKHVVYDDIDDKGHKTKTVKLSLCYEHTHPRHRNVVHNIADHYERHQDLDAAREWAHSLLEDDGRTRKANPAPDPRNYDTVNVRDALRGIDAQ